MIEIISQKNLQAMPWKNGKGKTDQISIFPAGSTVQKNNFLYRLSSAPVIESGEFSLFPGMHRILVPIQGAGFALDSDVYEKFEIAQFSGDTKIFCTLLKDSVVDLGLIYDPNKIKAHPRVLHLKSDFMISIESASHYLVSVLSGDIQIENKFLKMPETALFENETKMHLQIKKSAVVLFIKIDFI